MTEWKPITALKARGELVLVYSHEAGYTLAVDYEVEDTPEVANYYLAGVPEPPKGGGNADF